MTTTMSPAHGGGWALSRTHEATGTWSKPQRAGTGGATGITSVVSWAFVATAFLAPMNTGGDPAAQWQRVTSATQNSPIYREVDDEQPERTPSEDLEHVRAVFSPAISDLAVALGVSRQTIYNWIKGEPVADANAEKLRDLAAAADVLVEAGIPVSTALLKRKFASGKTLFQLVQSGGSARDAATTLVDIYKREEVQRARLKAKFAGRKKTPATEDFDLSEPNDQIE